MDGFAGTIHGLNSADRMLLLDTCGLASSVPRFINSGQAARVTGSGSIVTWGTVEVTAAGGQYRLCWCGGIDVNNHGNETIAFFRHIIFRLF
jgi:hypothetical protein